MLLTREHRRDRHASICTECKHSCGNVNILTWLMLLTRASTDVLAMMTPTTVMVRSDTAAPCARNGRRIFQTGPRLKFAHVMNFLRASANWRDAPQEP